MPKIKVPRKSTFVDMTAMCDVAFLLLTFFMLTAKFRPQEAVMVDIPASISKIKVPESNIAIVHVDRKGRAFFGVDNQQTRERLLEIMLAKYQVGMTPQQKEQFKLLENFGTSIKELPKYLNMDSDARNKYDKEVALGVPVDTTNGSAHNELADWVHQARIADQQLANAGLITSDGLIIGIKGDGNMEYQNYDAIVKSFIDREIYKFNLITTLKNFQP